MSSQQNETLSYWDIYFPIANATFARYSTGAPAVNQGWTALIAVKTGGFILSLVLNLAALIYHLVFPSQITHFTVYLVALFIANTVWLVTVRPIGLIMELYGAWLWNFPTCVFYNYCQRILSIVPAMCHVLISANNRLWAVTYPIHYREKHTKKMAVLICLAMVGYVHLLDLAPFLVDMLYYFKHDKEPTCQMVSGALIKWNRAEIILDRVFPLVFILTVYIYIMIRRWKRRSQGIASNVSPVKAEAAPATVKNGDPARALKPPQKTVKPFVVLMLSSVSVLVCWVPGYTFHVSGAIFSYPLGAKVLNIVSIIYALQMVFDPFMWFFSLRKSK